MNTNKKPTRRLLLAAHLGTIIFMVACSVEGAGTQSTDDGSIQVENGTLEIQNGDGHWVPIAGESAFELVGELESTDPWTVAGTTLETNESTQIEEGLQIGDLIRVRGTVLEDGTWLAYSIESAEEQTDPIIVLIGVVDSVDPWSVNGINLNVTEETDIQGEIAVGTIVRVEILLLEDGTWEVLSIAPLGESADTSGCVTIIATVLSVNGNEIQFLGWPTTVSLGVDNQTETNNQNNNEGEESDEDQSNDNTSETNDAGTVVAGSIVQAVICVSDDGTLVITQITILQLDDEGGGETNSGEKVLVCHKPDKKGGHTLSISSSAVPAHLAHGDTLGACP